MVTTVPVDPATGQAPPIGPAGPQHPAVRPRRVAEPRAGRGGGRALHRRRAAGPRLRPAAGADGGAVHRRPVRRRRVAAVPDRRPGPVAAGGQLEFLGRADDQVKVRGFRIEPGEVEAVLAGHPRRAGRRGAGRRPGRPARLVAYLVPADLAAASLRRATCGTSSGGACPSTWSRRRIVELAALPLTPNGKVDRAALPAPDGVAGGLAGYVRRPAGGGGAAGRDLVPGAGGGPGWGDGRVLRPGRALAAGHPGDVAGPGGVRRRGAAGGLVRPSDGAGPGCPGGGAGPRPAVPPLVAVPRDRALPLSFGQQRLWFLHQLEPRSAEYNLPSRSGSAATSTWRRWRLPWTRWWRGTRCCGPGWWRGRAASPAR